MIRNSKNVSKTKNLISEASEHSKANRNSFEIPFQNSNIMAYKNSSSQSEEDRNVDELIPMQQMNSNISHNDQELVIKKLQGQVKELRHKLKILEESAESKEYSLGTISREKDRAVGEIRRLEKSYRQLKQQLNDERNYYLEEKEKFCEEMTKYKKRLQEAKANNEGKKQNARWNQTLMISQQSFKWQFDKEKGDFADNKSIKLKISKSHKLDESKEQNRPIGSLSCSDSCLRKTGSLESLHLYEGKDTSLQMTALRTENAKLRSIISERDERNYELCLRFLRMKHCKNDIRTRFQDLENEYLQVITNLMEKIDEARQEFNYIIDQKFKKPLHSTNATYLRLVQRNSRMAFENASLRLENQCLKKELKKYMNGEVSELTRKIDQTSIFDESDPKALFKSSNSEGRLKKTKKNVNFKEIKTIFERNLAFKNSETDSNYMSKTSTTAISNASLSDSKSNEKYIEYVKDEAENEESKTEYTFQPNSLPNEILNKIFKRIDSSSCQTLNTYRSNDKSPEIKDMGSEEESKESKSLSKSFSTYKSKSKTNKCHTPKEIFPSDASDDHINRDVVKNSRLVKMKQKIFNLTDSSTPCASNESVHNESRLSKSHLLYSPPEYINISRKIESLSSIDKEAYFLIPQPGKDSSNALSIKPSYSSAKYLDRRSIKKENSSMNETLSFERRWLGKNEKIPRLNSRREMLRVQSRMRIPIKDSCALQEKLNVSRQELPQKACVVTTSIQTPAEFKEASQSEKSIGLCPPTLSDSKEKKRRVFNRHAYGGDLPTYDTKKIKSKELIDQESPSSPLNNASSRRPEGSKRFSHRLISTSPEQLKSFLTESQLEACYRMAPIVVGHATTEVNTDFPYVESNNDIILQLVIPAGSVGKSPQIFMKNDNAEMKETVDKETSMLGLSPAEGEMSNFQAEISPSDVHLSVSNLPTSNSTIDMVEMETINHKNNIMLRTLSAPGLLESSWLDPYTICEMRDCSTNT